MATEKPRDLIDRNQLFNNLADYWGIPRDWDGGVDKTCEDALGAIEDAPTVDAIEVPDKELLRAIKLLIKQYEHSKNSEYVHSPVAHALFHTWKQVEERRTAN